MKFAAFRIAAAAALVLQTFSPSVQAYTVGDVFASVGSGQVYVFDSSGVLKQTLDTTRGGFTTGGAFDSAGNFYVTNFSDGSISKFDSSGNLVNAQFISGFVAPESIVFDAAGNMYVGQADGDRDIRKFTSAGASITSFNVATTARGSDWIDLAADQTTMYYTSENFEIKRFDLSTSTQLADFASSNLRPKFALRILADGSVLVASSASVERFDNAGVLLQTYVVPGDNAFALNLDPNGTSFWTGDFGTGSIFRVNIATGAIEATFASGRPGNLFGLAVFGEITAGTPQVPEPGSLALLSLGLVGLGLSRRRKAN